MPRKLARRAKRLFGQLVLILVVLGGAVYWLQRPPANPPSITFIRFDKALPYADAIHQLAQRGLVKNTSVLNLVRFVAGTPSEIPAGTYRVGPNFSGFALLRSLRHSVHQIFTVPSTAFAGKVAARLELGAVCSSKDYLRLIHSPQEFASDVSFPLPDKSLEGYLYPGKYDFPPLLGARAVILAQLQQFQASVWEPLKHPADLPTALIKASLIQMEVNRSEERPLVASVIENRLAKGMKLQIDASVNYALGVWRPLHLSDLKNAPGPFNLYTHAGLPPSPICSPSYDSIYAALHPAQTNYLYYVALPSGKSLFAATFAEHQQNIAIRKKALAEEKRMEGKS